jgi:hypothetical protein
MRPTTVAALVPSLIAFILGLDTPRWLDTRPLDRGIHGICIDPLRKHSAHHLSVKFK